jgi:hypothetical protein
MLSLSSYPQSFWSLRCNCTLHGRVLLRQSIGDDKKGEGEKAERWLLWKTE